MLAHDVDRDGTRELIVRSVIEGDARDGELSVLWAGGRTARFEDGSIDGFSLRWWQVGPPDADGNIPWIAVAWCCAGLTVTTTTLSADGFAPIAHAHDDEALAACVDLPDVTFRARP